MTGSIQLKRGFWYAVIYYKDDSGEKKYKWISTGLTERGNKKAAKEILDRELRNFEAELNKSKEKLERRYRTKEIDRSKAYILFSDYVKEYLESIKSTLSPMVFESYYLYLMVRIRKFFDKDKLRVIDITTDDIVAFYEYLKEAGLRNKTLKHYANVMRPALKRAYKNKLIPDNPYDFVPPIEKDSRTVAYYDKNEMAKLFEAIKGHKFELAFKMAAYYGLRRSELLGLRWSSIDFEHKIIYINHKIIVVKKVVYQDDKLKTQTSTRTLPLIPAIEEDLRAHKERIIENKAYFKNSYDTRYLDYVFVKENGNLIYPDNLREQFLKVLKNNNLKRIRFHDLRHSCASIMLANGISIKQIQDWLGHADFSTTADIYSHLDFSSKLQSAQSIASALAPALPIEKPKAADATQSKQATFKSMMEEMRALGFDNFSDYYKYLNNASNDAVETDKYSDDYDCQNDEFDDNAESDDDFSM